MKKRIKSLIHLLFSCITETSVILKKSRRIDIMPWFNYVICLTIFQSTLEQVPGCCIVEHRFPHFTHQSGIIRHFPTFLTVFHGFLLFSPFTAHFCGKRHDFFAYAALQLKIVMLTTKMCGERRKDEKSVKNCQKCRKMSDDTRLVA